MDIVAEANKREIKVKKDHLSKSDHTALLEVRRVFQSGIVLLNDSNHSGSGQESLPAVLDDLADLAFEERVVEEVELRRFKEVRKQNKNEKQRFLHYSGPLPLI